MFPIAVRTYDKQICLFFYNLLRNVTQYVFPVHAAILQVVNKLLYFTICDYYCIISGMYSYIINSFKIRGEICTIDASATNCE